MWVGLPRSSSPSSRTPPDVSQHWTGASKRDLKRGEWPAGLPDLTVPTGKAEGPELRGSHQTILARQAQHLSTEPSFPASLLSELLRLFTKQLFAKWVNLAERGKSDSARRLPLLVKCPHGHPQHWKLLEEFRRGQQWTRDCKPGSSSKFPQFRAQPRGSFIGKSSS